MDLIEELGQWRSIMESLLGKKKWNSLTVYQQMCEIVAVKESNKNFFGNLFVFSDYES